MTVRLRAHHLLCMLTYVGKGYTPDFCANYDQIAARLARGEDILIVTGPDDVCAPLLATGAPHCHEDSVRQRDGEAAASLSRLLGTPVVPGLRFALDATMLGRFRSAFAAGETRTACNGCEWSPLCNTVAEHDFEGALITIR